MLTVEGNDMDGYWINKLPGVLRVSRIYTTRLEASRWLPFYGRLLHAEAHG